MACRLPGLRARSKSFLGLSSLEFGSAGQCGTEAGLGEGGHADLERIKPGPPTRKGTEWCLEHSRLCLLRGHFLPLTSLQNSPQKAKLGARSNIFSWKPEFNLLYKRKTKFVSVWRQGLMQRTRQGGKCNCRLGFSVKCFVFRGTNRGCEGVPILAAQN